jgi:very-short-patch-repair endonuclease
MREDQKRDAARALRRKATDAEQAMWRRRILRMLPAVEFDNEAVLD